MRTYVFTVCMLGLIFGLGSLAQDDGGCPATGQEPYDYSQALCMSFLFYEAQRSGYLPDDQRVTWRGDAALNDGSDVGQDLVGGYFDSADFMKYGFPLAFTTTTLSWGLLSFPAGYEKAGQTNYARTAIRRATDYILKAHTDHYELYGQVGNSDIDQTYWGRPEDMTIDRPSYKINSEAPGTELASETAAALASSYLVFKDDDDDTYANNLLAMARDIFDFADKFRETYVNSIPDASNSYNSWGSYGDDLAWAALWLYKATRERKYMSMALQYFDEFSLVYGSNYFYWDEKTPGVYAMLAELNTKNIYKERLDDYVKHLINDMQYTPKGLINLNAYGSLRHAAGVAFIAAKAASLGLNKKKYYNWAQSQLDYILGSTGQSFVVGFGVDPPLQPYHKAASCNDPPATCDFSDLSKPLPNPHVLYGAVVAGPDQYDNWEDDRTKYQQTSVALDYNSCYSGLLAAMIDPSGASSRVSFVLGNYSLFMIFSLIYIVPLL